MEQKQIVQSADFRRGGLAGAGGPIALEKVRSWTGNYRKLNDKNVTTSHFFGRKVIEKILNQKDCTGIRIHYAVDDRGQKQLILSGVDHEGKDQLPRQRVAVKEAHLDFAPQAADENMNDGNQFYDQSWPCPQTQGCPSVV